MNNVRHIANAPRERDIRTRPPRTAPDPEPLPPPYPPPPPPPDPEGFRPEHRARILLQQGIPTVFISGVSIRTWCSFGIFGEDDFVRSHGLICSANMSGIELWNNCTQHDGSRKLVIGGPDFNTEIDPTGTVGPFYVIPEGGYLVVRHYGSTYRVDGYITVTGYTVSLRDRQCGGISERIVDSYYMEGFGSGLYGCKSGGTHSFGRTFEGLEYPNHMVGYTYRPYNDCEHVMEGPMNEPTEYQREMFQWLWMHPVDIVL